MAYFLVRLLVYTTSVWVVMQVVPGLKPPPVPYVPEPYGMPLAYLAAGLVFGAVHAVGRPLLLFFSGGLYLWTLGFISVGLNALLFVYLAYVSAAPLELPGGLFISAGVGSVLMGLLVTLLEAVTGLDSPRRQAETRTTPPYWRWLELLPGSRNRAVEGLRKVQLVTTLRSYAIELFSHYTLIRPVRAFFKRRLYKLRPRLNESRPAVVTRLMLQEMGPTFVKFGQLVASRVEVLPAEWREQLALLQDRVHAFPAEEARRMVESELGAPLNTLYLYFAEEPLASASMGQVHEATLLNGTPVVVKVQRPNIEVVVRADLQLLRDLLVALERRIRAFRRLGLSPLFREFADTLIRELDFETEAYQARMLRHNMRELGYVEVPAVYTAYTTRRVLTMQLVEGIKITATDQLSAAGVNLRELALSFFRSLIKQVLVDGFFHADLHPGNVWYDTRAEKIVFLDMGAVGQLSRGDRVRLGQLIWALHDRAATTAAKVILGLCERPEIPTSGARWGTTLGASSAGVPRAAFALQRDVERLINTHLILGEQSGGLSELFAGIVSLLVRHDLRLRPEFTMAFKAIGQGEAIMRALMGEEEPAAIVDIAFRTMRGVLLERLAPSKLGGEVLLPLARETLGRLPNLLGAASEFLNDFEDGRSALQFDISEVDGRILDVQASFERGFRRMVLSISLAGLLLGSSLLLLAPLGDVLGGTEQWVVRLVAGTGVTVSGVMTASIVISMIWPFARREQRRQRLFESRR